MRYHLRHSSTGAVVNQTPSGNPGHAGIADLLSRLRGQAEFFGSAGLGRSFAVLPSLRDIRTSGMYRFVRHPIYLFYMVAGLGTLMRHPSLYNSSVVLAGVLLMMWRIRFEERLLSQDELYRNYMDVVRYRLIPGLY
jgi:protein-S-isoprenylcysteine O-methyltransferase Ste14